MNKNINNIKNYKTEQHPFHLVSQSPWPIITAIYLFYFVITVITWFHDDYIEHLNTFTLLLQNINLYFSLITISFWFNDIIKESTFEGFHTNKVQIGLKQGFLIFIISEIMFFGGFFWAFFHTSLAANIDIGQYWPPIGIYNLNTWTLPFLNTLILISSGIAVTYIHRLLVCKLLINYPLRYEISLAFGITIFYGLLFTFIQRYEYIHANFDISDSIYGATFYSLTGLHGLHVLVGTIFLIMGFLRHLKYHITIEHHFGLEAAIWYWHFVDVVWLFIFISVYWWAN
jgi:cytochrome c oxidase subunit 3